MCGYWNLEHALAGTNPRGGRHPHQTAVSWGSVACNVPLNARDTARYGQRERIDVAMF